MAITINVEQTQTPTTIKIIVNNDSDCEMDEDYLENIIYYYVLF